VGGHIFFDMGLGDMGDNAGVGGDVGRCHHRHCHHVNAGQGGGGDTAIIIALPLVVPIPLVIPLIIVMSMEGRVVVVVVSPPSLLPCPLSCPPPGCIGQCHAPNRFGAVNMEDYINIKQS